MASLRRLDDLQVLGHLEVKENVEETVKLDTRIVFDWMFQMSCWVKKTSYKPPLVYQIFAVDEHHDEFDGFCDGHFGCLLTGGAE